MDLSVQLAPNNAKGLLLGNPILTASGTFGYGIEYQKFFNIEELGGIICKGTTLLPKEGNPQPRIAETEMGMLNSVGLQNIGVEALIKEKAPVWETWQVPVIVNIAAESVEDYGTLAKRLDGVKGVSALEINISCPNVSAGCIEFGSDPLLAARVTEEVKSSTSLPVIIKLTPNTSDVTQVAKAVEREGADAVSLINTLRGMAIDIKTKKPILARKTGGLSGPAVKPVALAMVYQTAQAVSVPVIGCGGICTANDALEFIIAGASAVQVGTACFLNPKTPLDIIKGIKEYMQAEGVSSIKDIVGSLKV